ncbi:aminodeoxychorismate synthase component I [Thiomicrospira sp. R3]|uniref:aminodeoxychorismate synthase component I n=1 Tax=Thiomicrospira sp. R3 TaxID=3035472 RepID=UPI00259B62C0|nr:aminodeoxychorismate synthase component I [Thiomicrospira sp. R3]WFE67992.1 aminodeoxychorismate synthase component I [Thiomicrospira sp. R3]
MSSLSNAGLCVVRQPLQSVDLSRLAELHPQRYPHLLESVAQGQLGHFDILFAFAQSRLVLNDLSQAQVFIDDFQSQLKHNQACMDNSSNLPFYGGWFVYFGYEYAGVIEPSLHLATSKLPLAVLQRFPAAIIVDHHQQEVCFVAESEFEDCITQMQMDYAQQVGQFDAQSIVIKTLIEEPPLHYIEGVNRIKDYILAGDVFQVNLSRLWQLHLETLANPSQTASGVYRQLRQHNPAPFAGLVQLDEGVIISSSPERLVRYQVPWVDTRPIAGTRKRSDNHQEDLALIDELIQHPKERAEHIMLIDLERNDLGRICKPGSVEVNELMVVETYQHVHHIVSNVRGQLATDKSPLDIIHALFPGGTITGCPKIRCMEIIAELETGPREAYTGSVGYINRDGSMDTNILIRSFVLQADKLSFRAGAGIVADSDAEFELEETRHKAKGLLRALGLVG